MPKHTRNERELYLDLLSDIKQRQYNTEQQLDIFSKRQLLKAKKTTNRLIINIFLAYLAALIIVAIWFVFQDGTPFHSYRGTTPISNTAGDLSTINREIGKLKQEMKDLRETPVPPTEIGSSITALESRLTAAEQQQQAIADTILEDPEKALTARLLRDKQQTLQTSVDRLEQHTKQTNDRIDMLMITAIATPIITFILAIASFIVQYILSLSKAKTNSHHFAKENAPSDTVQSK